MRIQLVAGTGVGQYANILTYTNGSKVAQVTRPTFVPLTILSTTTSTNIITVASTATLYANMPVYIGTTVGGLSLGTVYYVVGSSLAASGGTTFQLSATSNGSAVALSTVSGTFTTTGSSISTSNGVTTLTIGSVTGCLLYTSPSPRD